MAPASVKTKFQRFAPGEAIRQPSPGDFLLTHSNSWTGWFIRFGQRIRYFGKDAKYAHWSHAALFINSDGDIIEAIGSGVQRRNISVYAGTEYHVLSLADVSDSDRQQAVRFAFHCLNESYGFLTILSIALSLLTGAKLGFGVDGQLICSGLVARALERTGEIFEHDPWHIMPADLAQHFNLVADAKDVGKIPDAKVGVQQRSKLVAWKGKK
jgi:hypothetical protein